MRYTPIFQVWMVAALIILQCSLTEGQRRPRRLPVRRPGNSRLTLPNRFSRISRRKPAHANFAPPPPGRELVVPALNVPSATVQHGSDGVRSLQHLFAVSGASLAPPAFAALPDHLQQATSTQRPPLSREQRAMIHELKTILGGEPLPIDPTSERSISFAIASARDHRSLPLFPPYDNKNFVAPSPNHFTDKENQNIAEEGQFFGEKQNVFGEVDPIEVADQFSQTTPSSWTVWNNNNNNKNDSKDYRDNSPEKGLENIQDDSSQVQQLLLNHIASDTADSRTASQNTLSSTYPDTTLNYIARFRQALLSRTEPPTDTWITEAAPLVSSFNNFQSSRRSGVRPLRGSGAFGYDSGVSSGDNTAALPRVAHHESVSTTTLPSPVFIPFETSAGKESRQTVLKEQKTTKNGVGGTSTEHTPVHKENRLLAIMPQDPDLLCSKVEAETGFCDTINKYPRRYMDRVLDQCSTILEYLYSEVPELGQAELDTASTTSVDGVDPYSSWSWPRRSPPSCRTNRLQLSPTYARATDGRWYVLLQHGHVTQRVTVSTCGEVGQVRSGCRQLHHYRTLIAADPRLPTKCPRMRTFRFPAGCSCADEAEQQGS